MDYLTKTYVRMAATLDPSDDYFETDSRFMTLEGVLSVLPRGKMCDIGCGRGALIRRMQKHHEVFGCEYEPGAVEACVAAGLNVRRVDLNNDVSLPFPAKFDAVVISEVCEHLLDPRNAIRLAKNALAPGGTLVVTVPNAVPLFARMAVLFGRTVDWLHYPSPDTELTGHVRFYTVKSMSQLLREEGLQVTGVRGVSFRMNGYFWERVCFWVAKFFMKKRKAAPAQVDAWLGRKLPGLSPGLLFVARLP